MILSILIGEAWEDSSLEYPSSSSDPMLNRLILARRRGKLLCGTGADCLLFLGCFWFGLEVSNSVIAELPFELLCEVPPATLLDVVTFVSNPSCGRRASFLLIFHNRSRS